MTVATFWISEVVPLSVTALFPLVLFPLLNIAKAKDVATQYFNDGWNSWDPSPLVIFLFFAGFLMSLAMEKWHLDMRIALSIMKFFSKPSSMLFGIMLVSAFLSIFVSNTGRTGIVPITRSRRCDDGEHLQGPRRIVGDAFRPRRRWLGLPKSIFLGIASVFAPSFILASPRPSAAFPR